MIYRVESEIVHLYIKSMPRSPWFTGTFFLGCVESSFLFPISTNGTDVKHTYPLWVYICLFYFLYNVKSSLYDITSRAPAPLK